MAGDHPTPGAGDTPGGGQDNRGVSLGRKPGGVDPAAVADQQTQLDGSAVPGQGAPPAPAGAPPAPGMPPAQPPAQPAAGQAYAYAPTAPAFPAQGPPPGAPVGPYDPTAGQQQFGAPNAGQPYGYAAPPPADGGAGYGYPQQGGYGFPGAPVPAPPKQRNPVMIWGGIIGGVLAIAIVAALVVLFTDEKKKDDPPAATGGTTGEVTAGTTSGTTGGTTTAPTTGTSGGPTAPTGGGKAGAYNLAWAAEKPANGASGSRLLAIWGADKVAVRADTTGIRGISTVDGKESWNIPVPAGTKEFCSASYSTNSKHIAAISLNTGDSDCSTIAAVDVAAGKLLWTVKVGQQRMSSPSLTVTDKVVGIGANMAGAINVADGSAVWAFQPREKDCSVYGTAAGAQIVVTDRCYGLNTTVKSQLVVVETDSGKVTSPAPVTLTGTIERVDKVLSDQPLVVLVTNGPNGDYVLPFDKTNKAANPMSVKEPGYDSLRLSGQADAFSLNVISGTTLYVQTNPTKPAINAYDLNTGKRLWSTTGDAKDGLRLVSGTDKDGKVRAILDMGYGKDARLVTLSPTDGAVTELGTIIESKNVDLNISLSLTEFVMQSDGSLYGFGRNSSDAPVAKYVKK
ncbi:outer membrane protein assembly factor BamB family protein [Kitasatospora sp. NBC_00458]|uniref:outer membrane protein assembly factor BamB family protein n=1 Tax=Kitasatospora sp. NBC_00458 TaxID=2903568 RepID=UPI002E18454B